MSDQKRYDYEDFEWLKEVAANYAKTRAGRSQVFCMEAECGGYIEPGYDDPENGWIVLGNWNTVSHYDEQARRFHDIDDVMPRLGKILEALGCDLQWEDEWTRCFECLGVVRTSPDGWGWKPSYVITESEGPTCINCLAQEPEDYLEELEGDSRRACQVELDLEKAGYRKIDIEFENGLYGGQSASPGKIGELLDAADFERYIFNIDSTGQFDTRFSVWLHEDECEDGGLEAAEAALKCGSTNGPDPAEMMKKAMEQASAQTKELRKAGSDGIVYSKIKDDGTAETTIVSAQDFIDGKLP